MLDLDSARKELTEKSYTEIEEHTAWTWASRACVVYQFISESSNEDEFNLCMLAEDYYHEAIEHAALVEGKGPELLKEVIEAITPYREKVYEKEDSSLAG